MEVQPVSARTLVIGAGELGLAVIDALLQGASESSTSVHVLLREPVHEAGEQKAEQLKQRGVSIVHSDLASATADELALIFGQYSTVVCCCGFVGGAGTQRKITAAVLGAGVQRYVPWQFGVDYDAIGRGSGQPVWDEQLDVRQMLRGQDTTRWIIISTGMFLSFLFEPAFDVVDLRRGKVHALGDWQHRLTLTTPRDIGILTAAILAHQPAISNQVVYLAGDTLSYAQLADTVEQHMGRKVERVLWDQQHLRSQVAAHPHDVFCKYRLAFARSDGVAWDKGNTINAAWQMRATDVAQYLAQRKADGDGG